MLTLAQQYREVVRLKNMWALEAFLSKNAIVESHKYFPDKIGWFWHTIVFVDGSVFILSYNVAERGAIEYFTGLPYLPSEE